MNNARIVLWALLVSLVAAAFLFFLDSSSIGQVVGVSTISPLQPDYVSEVYARNVYGEMKQEGFLIMRVGESIPLYFTVKNAGTLASIKPSHVLAESGFEFSTPALGTGKSLTKQFYFKCESEGRFNVFVYADYYNEIAESNEANNDAFIHVSCVNFGPQG